MIKINFTMTITSSTKQGKYIKKKLKTLTNDNHSIDVSKLFTKNQKAIITEVSNTNNHNYIDVLTFIKMELVNTVKTKKEDI